MLSVTDSVSCKQGYTCAWSCKESDLPLHTSLYMLHQCVANGEHTGMAAARSPQQKYPSKVRSCRSH